MAGIEWSDLRNGCVVRLGSALWFPHVAWRGLQEKDACPHRPHLANADSEVLSWGKNLKQISNFDDQLDGVTPQIDLFKISP